MQQIQHSCFKKNAKSKQMCRNGRDYKQNCIIENHRYAIVLSVLSSVHVPRIFVALVQILSLADNIQDQPKFLRMKLKPVSNGHWSYCVRKHYVSKPITFSASFFGKYVLDKANKVKTPLIAKLKTRNVNFFGGLG